MIIEQTLKHLQRLYNLEIFKIVWIIHDNNTRF